MTKRYLPDGFGEMEECEYGDYVKFKDYQLLEEEVINLRFIITQENYKRDIRRISLPHRG